MGPPGGKKLVIFVDDFNMPKKDEFGSQPPLELLRQQMEYGGWYDRAKCAWRFMLDLQLLVAMGPPGGGRSVMSPRLQSKFLLLNFTAPASAEIKRIFECILGPGLSEFDDEIKPLGSAFVDATLNIYNSMLSDFLPTPAKCHYLFNMRDMAKVVQGILCANKHYMDSKQSMLRLWVHETSRVFGDRLISEADLKSFHGLVSKQLETVLDTKFEDLMGDIEVDSPIFVNFMSDPVGDNGERIYEEVGSIQPLRALLEEQLDDYNVEPGNIPMNLVLFVDAVKHVARITRVISQPRGNALLLGIGGSGRQSLTRLSAFIQGYKLFQIEITKNYGSLEFHEDIKKLYIMAGVERKPTVFLFNDTQVKENSFWKI